MSAVFFLFSSVLIRILWPKWKPDIPWICPVLTLALPFSAGGFHIATSAVLSLILTVALWEQFHKQSVFQFFANHTSVSVLLLFFAYCVTPFWAADKGMARFAFVKYLPVVLYMLLVMQSSEILHRQVLGLIPACGCLMTVATTLALCIPELRSYVIVNGRLTGFFQYPNSFAAFLLVGLIVQNFRNPHNADMVVSFLLVAGIILSGSKTVFLLMLVFATAIVLVKRKLLPLLILCSALICGFGVGLLASGIELLFDADRFTDIHASSHTFLIRLLYFRDVIPAITSHPFGVGYLGYPAIEGAIQTGRYYVTYIHNEFLQILLEIGWIPAAGIAFAFLSAIFSRKTAMMHRLILLAVLSHCMLDFDLQFSIFWIILLSCMDLLTGRQIRIGTIRLTCCITALLTVGSLWLGSGDWLYRLKKPDLALLVTPFHTEALTYQMSVCEIPQQMDEIADRILALNSIHSLALSVKANVAFSMGDIESMIQYKESAIQASRYTTAEYCDYFNKLYMAMQAYLRSGDISSAAYCRNKLLQIPEMMVAVVQQAHSLSDLSEDDSILVLPPEYIAILQQLQ